MSLHLIVLVRVKVLAAEAFLNLSLSIVAFQHIGAKKFEVECGSTFAMMKRLAVGYFTLLTFV